MVEIDITLSRIEDSVILISGETAKTVETNTQFINYFFFSATSIDYTASTMTLKYDAHAGWVPEACLAVCTNDPSSETYAIRITSPKFSSSASSVEYRTVYTEGRIQTASPSVSSSYNIGVKTNGCPEVERFILSYETFDDDSEKIAKYNEDINFNVEYIIKKNIDNFTDADPSAKMLHIAARRVWDVNDSDFDRYAYDEQASYTKEKYETCTEETSPTLGKNTRIYRNDNAVELGAGFYKTSGSSFDELLYRPIYNEYIDGDDNTIYRVDLVFDEPLEAIGYHTFYLGRHFNDESLPYPYEDDYIGYADKEGLSHYYYPGDTGTSINENIFFDGKLSCTYIRQNYKREPREYADYDGAKRMWNSSGRYYYSEINENEYLFEESNNIKGIKTGKYLKIIGNQAFKKLRNLEYIDFEGSPLERIGMYAFEGCEALETIDIPDTVTLIGEGAFKRSYINKITIPSGMKMIEAETFRLCKNLEEVDFSNCTSLYKICNDAFRGCWNISGLTFPSSLVRIERMAFGECDSIKNVTFNSGLEYIGYRAFDKCTSITDLTINAVTIGDRAFNNCTSLTSVTFTSDVRYIGDSAFLHVPLSSITFSNGLVSIGDAFCDSNAHIVEVPNSVASIGGAAFAGTDIVVYTGSATGAPWGAEYVVALIDNHIGYGDTAKTIIRVCEDKSITNVTIISSVRTIDNKAFVDCDSLTALTIPTGVTSIGNYAFSGCTSLSSLTIPNNVITIGDGAFYNCSGITTLSLSNELSTISHEAFRYCSSLTSVTIYNSATSIGNDAFSDCVALREVTIPSSVTSIGSHAFYNCTSITTIRYGGTATDWINNVTRGTLWSGGITGTSVVICSGGTEAPLNP